MKTLAGGRILVEVESSMMEKVESLKVKIRKEVQIPEYQQRLIYAGKQLQDGRTLRNYNIHEYSIIHLVMRLRGAIWCAEIYWSYIYTPE